MSTNYTLSKTSSKATEDRELRLTLTQLLSRTQRVQIILSWLWRCHTQ